MGVPKSRKLIILESFNAHNIAGRTLNEIICLVARACHTTQKYVKIVLKEKNLL